MKRLFVSAVVCPLISFVLNGFRDASYCRICKDSYTRLSLQNSERFSVYISSRPQVVLGGGSSCSLFFGLRANERIHEATGLRRTYDAHHPSNPGISDWQLIKPTIWADRRSPVFPQARASFWAHYIFQAIRSMGMAKNRVFRRSLD